MLLTSKKCYFEQVLLCDPANTVDFDNVWVTKRQYYHTVIDSYPYIDLYQYFFICIFEWRAKYIICMSKYIFCYDMLTVVPFI